MASRNGSAGRSPVVPHFDDDRTTVETPLGVFACAQNGTNQFCHAAEASAQSRGRASFTVKRLRAK